MKSPLILAFLIFIFTESAFSQEVKDKTNGQQIGLTFSSLGNNDFGRIRALDGAASHYGKHFYSIGISYLLPIKNRLALETGLEYENHTITTHPMIIPNVEYHITQTQHEISLISIPILIRWTFANYFFAQGGTFLDLDLSDANDLDDQTGLGINLGLGAKYDFKCGISMFVNPYLKYHSIIPFTPEKYQNHLWESAFRLGVAYRW